MGGKSAWGASGGGEAVPVGSPQLLRNDEMPQDEGDTDPGTETPLSARPPSVLMALHARMKTAGTDGCRGLLLSELRRTELAHYVSSKVDR